MPHFIKFGFPEGFSPDCRNKLIHTSDNYSLAIDHIEDVNKYINVEKQHGAISSPFSVPPYGNGTHCSPFMSTLKSDSDTRRIIIDLSWPKGGSVNDFAASNSYLGTYFKVKYPTVDSNTDYFAKFGPGTCIFKVDLSHAFRQLPIDPFDYDLLCL